MIREHEKRRRAASKQRRRQHFRSNGTPKVPFSARAVADQAAERAQASWGRPYRAYRCRCGWWHIGS